MVNSIDEAFIDQASQERDSQWRHAALQQAAHDYKGNQTAEKVVDRARVYYEFLREPLSPAGGE